MVCGRKTKGQKEQSKASGQRKIDGKQHRPRAFPPHSETEQQKEKQGGSGPQTGKDRGLLQHGVDRFINGKAADGRGKGIAVCITNSRIQAAHAGRAKEKAKRAVTSQMTTVESFRFIRIAPLYKMAECGLDRINSIRPPYSATHVSISANRSFCVMPERKSSSA